MTSTMIHTSRTHPGPIITVATSTTSCSIVSINFTQRPNTETETPEHNTLNNTLVLRNEVLNSTWKLSANHAPYIHNAEIRQDKRIILYEGSKLENQHTRKTLGTLSWVYKPSNYPMVIGGDNPCWSYRSQDLCPTKTVRHRDAHSSAKVRFIQRLRWSGSSHFRLSDRYFLNMVRLNDHTRN